jgi:ParB family chromosome partitioning protein
MGKDQKRLGRGLSALLSDDLVRRDITSHNDGNGESSGSHRLANVPVDSIRPNPYQPRKVFDESALGRLAESLRTRGTLQPVIVSKKNDGFELVAGERRWRAARLAGLATVPAIIRETSEHDMLELALIENIHREDLNPVDRARGYLEIFNRFKITKEELASRTGEDRATVANYIRILDLPDEVLVMLADGRLTMGHGRALLGLADAMLRSTLAQRAAAENWSVRRIEEKVREMASKPASRSAEEPRATVKDMEQRLTEALGARVRVLEGRRRNTGRIIIDYQSLDDFERIASRLGLDPEI